MELMTNPIRGGTAKVQNTLSPQIATKPTIEFTTTAIHNFNLPRRYRIAVTMSAKARAMIPTKIPATRAASDSITAKCGSSSYFFALR